MALRVFQPAFAGSTSRSSPELMSRSVASAAAGEDQRVPRADAVRLLHLALDRPVREIEVGGQTRPAQLGHQREGARRGPRRRPPRRPHLARAGRLRSAVLLEREGDAVDPESPAAARCRRAAELLDQAVVAPAAPDSRLRPEALALELEDRARVVVEPADQGRVELVGDAIRLEKLANPLEVLGVRLVEAVKQSRCVGHHLPRALVVGVESPQWVGVDPVR